MSIEGLTFDGVTLWSRDTFLDRSSVSQRMFLVAAAFRPTGFPVKHVIGLHRRDLRDGGENVRAVHGGSLQTVAVVDLPLPCLSVYIELSKQTERETRR